MLSTVDLGHISRQLKLLKLKTLQEYYSSPTWRKRRAEHTSLKKYHCHCCSVTKGLELHHLSYKRLGEELFGDLVWLCGECHEQVHLTYETLLAEDTALTIDQATDFWRDICREDKAQEEAKGERRKRNGWRPPEPLPTLAPRNWRTNPAKTIKHDHAMKFGPIVSIPQSWRGA